MSNCVVKFSLWSEDQRCDLKRRSDTISLFQLWLVCNVAGCE